MNLEFFLQILLLIFSSEAIAKIPFFIWFDISAWYYIIVLQIVS